MIRTRSMVMILAPALLLLGCDKKEGEAKKSDEAAEPGNAEGGGAGGGGRDEVAAGALDVVQVGAGQSFACALMNNGSVRCWGRNDRGEMGIEPSETDAATPVEIPGVSKAQALWVGGDSGSSGDMACARLESGGLTCWGSSALKPKEEGKKWTNTPEEISALKGFKDLALGGGTQYAIKPDGSVVAWGSPAFNAIGDGEAGSFGDKGITAVPGVSKAVGLAAGQNHACALIEGGSVTCWGYSGTKQAPTPIEGLADVVSIASGSGGSDTCAVKKDGTAWCWGEQQEPKQVEGLAGVKMIRGRTHMCAALEDGSVHCWGSNARGQLGTGEMGKTAYKPQKVQGLADAVFVDAGAQTTCAALKDGEAKCWGYNQRGQLGDGTLIDRATPVDVVSLTAAKLPPPKDGADQAQEAEVAMDWSGLPEACTKPATIEAENDKLEGPFEVVSAYANAQGGGKTIGVDIGNYKMDPKSAWDAPRGKQFKLSLRFGKVDLESKEAHPVDLGEYVFGLEQERKVMTSVSHKAGTVTLMRLSLEGASPGVVKLTHLDEGWVCGELDLKTKHSSFKGPFAARFPAE